jgi:hypothetical protein
MPFTMAVNVVTVSSRRGASCGFGATSGADVDTACRVLRHPAASPTAATKTSIYLNLINLYN